MICMKAPAKIILFGEHFVVKGKPAIAVAVKLYATTRISNSDNDYILYAENLGLKTILNKENIPSQLLPFKKIYEIIDEEYGRIKPFKAVITSEIPIGAGMGSSAATAVSFTAALLEYLGIEYSREDVSRIAFEAEKITHGKPSGIDNTASTYGGIIYYRAGEVKRINYAWPNDPVLVASDTGILRNTKTLVEKVLERYERYSDVFRQVYNAAEKIVEIALDKLREGRWNELGELMNINHGLLVAIGVSNNVIEDIRYTMLKNNALGAKITGAGGGGLVIGLAWRKDIRQIIYKLRSKHYENNYVLEIDNNGVSKCKQFS